MAWMFLSVENYGIDFCLRSVKIWFFRNSMYLSLVWISFSARSRRVRSYGTVISLLIFGVFLIFFAEIPNRRVDIVSEMLLGWGEQVTIKLVFEFPPKDSWRTLVSLLSLYGIWVDFPSVRELITFPKVVKLALIFLASSNVFPYAPVLEIFSLPARSTRYNFPVLALRSATLSWLTVRIKIIWDREDL